jgi:hypothetical protein
MSHGKAKAPVHAVMLAETDPLVGAYAMLAVAKLARVVADACGQIATGGGLRHDVPRDLIMAEAWACLRDREAMEFWCGLAEVEVDFFLDCVRQWLGGFNG